MAALYNVEGCALHDAGIVRCTLLPVASHSLALSKISLYRCSMADPATSRSNATTATAASAKLTAVPKAWPRVNLPTHFLPTDGVDNRMSCFPVTQSYSDGAVTGGRAVCRSADPCCTCSRCSSLDRSLHFPESGTGRGAPMPNPSPTKAAHRWRHQRTTCPSLFIHVQYVLSTPV
jgi:hypothetical protein